MRKFLLLLLLLFISSSIFSSPSGLVAKFSLERKLSGMEGGITSSGDVYIDPEEGILFFTKTPFPSRMLLGLDVMKEKVGSFETTTSDMSGNAIYTTFSSALGKAAFGSFEGLEGLFDVAVKDDGVVLLTPKGDASRFISYILIDFENEIINTIEMEDGSGNVTIYRFEDVALRSLESSEKEAFNF